MSQAIAHSVHATRHPFGGDFLSRLEVTHGPVNLLGRFFLKAYSDALSRGIALSFASSADLIETNKSNPDSWLPLVPVFDDRFFDATPDNVFCIVGRDATGRIVATHACRLYDWSGTNFEAEAGSLRMFYCDPNHMRLPGETCEVTAPSAKTITGLTIFSGAAWCHPDFRGKGVSSILPLIGKAYALTLWPAPRIVGLMAEKMHARGFASHFGYTSVDWNIFWTNSPMGTLRLALLTVMREQTFDRVREYLAGGAEVEFSVSNRRA